MIYKKDNNEVTWERGTAGECNIKTRLCLYIFTVCMSIPSVYRLRGCVIIITIILNASSPI